MHAFQHPDQLCSIFPVHMKEVEDYNGAERASIPQRLPTSEVFPLKPPGTPLVPSNDCMSRMHQSVMEAEPAKQHLGTMLQELSPPAVSGPLPPVATPPRPMSTVHHQTVLGTSTVQSSESASISVSPPRIPTQFLATPPLVVQGLRPVPASVPSSSVLESSALSMPPSLSAPPQVGQDSDAPPPAVSAPPPVKSHSQSVAITSTAEGPGSGGLQVPKTLVSQETPPPVLSTPSTVLAPPQRAMTCGLVSSSPAPTAALSASKTVDDYSLSLDSVTPPAVSTLAPASVFTRMNSSPPRFSAPPLVVSATPQASPSPPPSTIAAPKAAVSSAGSVSPLEDVASKSSHPQSPGRMTSHEAEPRPRCLQKTSDDPNISLLSRSEVLERSSEKPLRTTGPVDLGKDVTPVIEKDPGTSKDRAGSGKGEDDTLGTETSLLESASADVSEAKGPGSLDSCDVSLNDASRTEGSSMFTDDATTDVTKDGWPEDSVREGTSYEKVDSCSATRSFSDDTSLRDHSQTDYSLNDTSQNDTSQLSSSLNGCSIPSSEGEVL